MADPLVNIGGDASGAVAACLEAQRAINAVHGKTESIKLEVTGGNAATSEMGRFGQATDAATAAHERHSSSVRNADAFVQRYRDNLDAMSSRMRDVGSESDRAGAGVRGLGNDTDRTRDHVGGLGRGVEDVTGGVGLLGRSLGGLGSGSASAGAGLGSVAGPLQAFGTGALYATAGAGLLTAGVGALGAAGVATLGGVGAALGAAGVGLTAFTADILTGSKKDPGPLFAEFTDIGNQVKGFEQQAVRPYGDALVRMAHEGLAAAPGIVAPVKDAFTEIGQVAEGGTKDMIKSAGLLADGFKEVTHDAAPAFAEFFKDLPALTSAVVDPADQLVKKFSSLTGAATEGVPAFGRMLGSVGDLGSELLQVGADNLTPFENDVTSMVSGVTGAVHNLAPAIKPAMGAVTDTVNAVTGALSDPKVAKGIEEFSATVTKNGPQITHALTGIAEGALKVGSATVATAGGVADFADHAVGGTLPGVGEGGTFQRDPGAPEHGPIHRFLARRLGLDDSAGTVGGAAQAGGPTDIGPAATHDRGPATFPGIAPGPGTLGSFLQRPGQIPALHPSIGQPAPPPGAGPQPPHGAPGGDAGVGGGFPSVAQLQALGPAASQSMSQVQSSIQTGAQSFAPFTASVGQAAQQLQTQVPQAAQTAAVGIQQAPMAPAMQQQTGHLTQMMDQMSTDLGAGGQSAGAAMAGGIAEGYTRTETVVDTVIRKHILKIIDIPAEVLDAHSPARTFIPHGESMPLGLAAGYQNTAGVATAAVVGGMNDLIDAAGAVAGSGRTKEVGEVWAQNIMGGIPAVFKQGSLEQISMPKIPSLLGAADLAAQGLLGPAGSGAFQNKAFIANGGGALPNGAGAAGGSSFQANINVLLDSAPFHAMIYQHVVEYSAAVADARDAAR